MITRWYQGIYSVFSPIVQVHFKEQDSLGNSNSGQVSISFYTRESHDNTQVGTWTKATCKALLELLLFASVEQCCATSPSQIVSSKGARRAAWMGSSHLALTVVLFPHCDQMARENQSGIEQQPLRTSIRHCSHSTTAKGQKCGYPYGHLNPTSARNRAVS